MDRSRNSLKKEDARDSFRGDALRSRPRTVRSELAVMDKRCYVRGATDATAHVLLAGSPVVSVAPLQDLLHYFASWYGLCVSGA